MKCDICEEVLDEEELTDTTGLINGNVGYVCTQCLEDNDIGVK